MSHSAAHTRDGEVTHRRVLPKLNGQVNNFFRLKLHCRSVDMLLDSLSSTSNVTFCEHLVLVTRFIGTLHVQFTMTSLNFIVSKLNVIRTNVCIWHIIDGKIQLKLHNSCFYNSPSAIFKTKESFSLSSGITILQNKEHHILVCQLQRRIHI